MKEFFVSSPILAWSLVSIMAAGFVIMLMWEKMKWWWHNTWFSFPVIGRITSLSKDLNMDTATGWFKAEKTLCSNYKKFIRISDEHDFNEKIAYITKAGDLGRSSTPTFIWILTIALVFIEAMGFSYVLAGYTIPGASENTQQYGAIGIAFLVSVILVAFTHFSGHELYVSGKIKQARHDWSEDESTQPNGERFKFRTGEVALNQPQSCDDMFPSYTQLANRVGTQPNYKITIATIICVLVVAIGATYVRGQVLEDQLLQEVTNKTENISLSLNVDDGLDMFGDLNASQLPAEDVEEQAKVERKATNESIDNHRRGGWGTFIVLAFIFIFLQLLGVIFGYKWGFAGKESFRAYNAIGRGRYSTYADVREHYQEIADIAQAKLENLQQKLMANLINKGNSKKIAGKTFRNFMEEERELQAKEYHQQREYASARAAAIKASTTGPAISEPILQSDDLGEIIAHIDSLDSPQDKKSYMASLSTDIRNRAIAFIKERKQAEEKAKEEAELDGLFD
jgi:hypothetical protein